MAAYVAAAAASPARRIVAIPANKGPATDTALVAAALFPRSLRSFLILSVALDTPPPPPPDSRVKYPHVFGLSSFRAEEKYETQTTALLRFVKGLDGHANRLHALPRSRRL